MNYLDKIGLTYFFSKLKEKFATKEEYNSLLARIEELEQNLKPSNINILNKNIIYNPVENGIYNIFYADSNKTELSNFEKIAQLDYSGTEVSYDKFNDKNIAPSEAEYIISKKDNTLIDYIKIPSNWKINNMGNKLYSFGLLSDIHIDGDGSDNADSINDFTKELQYFKSNNVDFIGITGDLTYDGRVEDYQKYKEIVNANVSDIPIIACAGNHDILTEFTNWETYVDTKGRYYEWEYNSDKYIILGLENDNLSSNFISDETLNWLIEKLNTYRNQRVFLLFHVFVEPVGNVNQLYPYSVLSGAKAEKFIKVLTHFKNVIFLSGHSHLDYRLQEYGKDANISINRETCQRLHTPSGSRPRKNDTGGSSSDTYNYLQGCEGAIIEVYENGLIIQGRDFETNENLPIARYYMETSVIDVDEYVEEPSGEIITPEMEFGNINYRTDGELSDSTDYIRTKDYVPVTEGNEYRISNNTPDSLNTLCVFYDNNYSFIKGWNSDGGTTYNHKNVVNGETIIAPSTAKYMKCRISVQDTSTVLTIEKI